MQVLKKRLKMGATRREEGILKLVHPGRHVEIHREPIRAAEILRRNPRHCITRPDVFENPWIVVKPEAILHPGKVFLIVPHHTIYRLLKANGHCTTQSSSPQQTQSPKLPKQTSPQSCAGMTPKHQNHDRPLMSSSWDEVCPCKKHSHEMVAKYIDSYLQFEEESPVDHLMISSSHAKENYYRDSNRMISAALPKNGDGEFSCSKQVTKLRSCLRKQDSIRKSLPLRVGFLLPNEDDKRQKRVTVSPTEFPGFHTW